VACILEGSKIKEKLLQELEKEFSKLQPITLASITTLKNFSIQVYVNQQKKVCSLLGVKFLEIHEESAHKIFKVIEDLNRNKGVKGIVVHKPTKEGLNFWEIAEKISPSKDVEGVNSFNMGSLFKGKPTIIPPTASACFYLIKSTGQVLRGKNAVIVGASEIVGKPLSMLLLEELCTVSICHIGTHQAGFLEEYVKRADILCCCAGVPSLIKGDWIKEGAIVIDVGINYKDGKIVGDVEFEEAKKRAGFITPVPGGVGPITVMFLFKNLLYLAKSDLK